MKALATFAVETAHFFLCAFPSVITAQLLHGQCNLRKYSKELSLALETQLSVRKLSCPACKKAEQMAGKTAMLFRHRKFSLLFKVSCQKRLRT